MWRIRPPWSLYLGPVKHHSAGSADLGAPITPEMLRGHVDPSHCWRPSLSTRYAEMTFRKQFREPPLCRHADTPHSLN
ncbi:hypothetical protein DPEC_G00182960 [Dallia pectoralis]|uniref:Uncharacterized protein n=1 Tax=Dallia pectoralis TaxID=75939 RepID=A0ACC2GAI6_DALPE|nr:hypothetical protein DPEC_G00182960 [Dallia pectoralis]